MAVRLLGSRAVIGALLLAVTSVTEGATTIDGVDYVRSGSVEALTAPFGGPGLPTAAHNNVQTQATYSGFVEVLVSGTGQSSGTQRNDAFYVYTDGAGNDITPANHPSFYQLAIDTAAILGTPQAPTPPSQLARRLVVFDLDAPQATTPPYVPAYRSGHVYRFVIDVARTAAWSGSPGRLNFSVGNGIYEDNSGAYHIELHQLVERVDGEAVLLQAAPSSGGTRVTVQVSGGAPGGPLPDIEVLTADSCTGGVLGEPTTTLAVLTSPSNRITGNSSFDAEGNAFIVEEVSAAAAQYAAARVLGSGTAGMASRCIVAGPDNDSWTRAQRISLQGGGALQSGSAAGFVDLPGRARWYRFSVQPDAKAVIELTGLPTDLDLVVFRDIAQAFDELEAGNPSDVAGLDRLGAEFAPSRLDTTEISPFAFSPSEVSPFAFSPFAFSPFAFSPSLFAGDAVAPFAFSPFAFSPSASANSDYSPFAFSPFAFSPFAFSPFAFSAENYSSAQTRSVIAVSALNGTATERVSALTWANTGDFYIRVAGKNGAADDQTPFSINVTYDPGLCAGVLPEPLGGISGAPGNYQTIILYDSRQLALSGHTPAQQAPLVARLNTLAGRNEVRGVVVDLAAIDEVQRLHDQAELRNSCPYAANLTAGAIKRVIDVYRQLNPGLAYVVLAGGDAQIPFFRYPDQTLLGPEQNYDPPMADFTQSQAALRLNYVLGQDEYGASTTLLLGSSRFPVPDLAVGRLVETPAEMITVLDAYLATANGVVATPTSTLVTGYDFLTDAANAIQLELARGVGGRNDTLITPAQFSPDAPQSWNADALRSALLGTGEDVIFLAGHFNAFSALAADFETSMLSTELIDSSVDLRNSLVFSAGCHSGYNAVNEEIRQGVGLPPDWAQAFARKGATLIAGTGYQYGDTEFIEFGERLYLEFARRLRTGTGPVAVGRALVAAKQAYLRQVPDNKGLHPKTLLISTVFGLPMLRIDMPGSRLAEAPDNPVVHNFGPVPAGTPGRTLGLQSAELNLNFAGDLQEVSVALKDLADPNLASTVTATYLAGPGFALSISPGEPVVPIRSLNVSVPMTSLRGVGFRGGDWSDEFPVLPLDGAATTELRAPHTRFASLVDFPMRLAIPNYYGSIADSGGTRLHVTPVQHRVEEIGGPAVRRRFLDTDFRLFYSANTQSYGSNRPALSAPPSLSGARAFIEGADVVFTVTVVGDPAAGIQSVWVTYTDGSGSSGSWAPLDLSQDATDTRLWRGRLVGRAAAFAAGRLDAVFHAVNGVGLVTSDDNFGRYYGLLSGAAAALTPTTMSFLAAGSGTVVNGTVVPVSAALETGAGAPVSDATVLFTLGSTIRSARTDSAGIATAELPVNTVPSSTPYKLVASFGGTTTLAASAVERNLTVQKTPTRLNLARGPQNVRVDGVDAGLSATLTAADANRTPLQLRTVYFTLQGPTGEITLPRTTDFQGVARLGEVALPAGGYQVVARFLGVIPNVLGEIVDPVYRAAAARGPLALSNGRGCPAPARPKGKHDHHGKSDDRHGKSNDKHGKSDDRHHKSDDKHSKGHKPPKHLDLTGFCYLLDDVDGKVSIANGTLIVGERVHVDQKVDQHGAGSVQVAAGATIRGQVTENGSGDVSVLGEVGGNLQESGTGAVSVGLSGEVDGNVWEADDGSLVVDGKIDGNASESAAGDFLIGPRGSIRGHAAETGPGVLINQGFVKGKISQD